MGNTPSTAKKSAETEFKNFYDVIDYVATYYVLTMDFKSLSKLSEKEYCDKLIILTADIIEKHFNEREITYLEQRIKDGLEVNSLNTEKFVFIDRDKLDSLDISNETKKSLQKNIKKNRVCIGIAKFYVKIAHIFAAIVMTINPVYTYTDPESGVTMSSSLLEKDKIPKKADRKLFKFNICDNRIRALKRDELIDEETKSVYLEPEICGINADESGMPKTLGDEPGINELMQLYYDEYDSKTGSFSKMTTATKALFDRDLKSFYTAFTGEETMPPEITRFSDIRLKDYSRTQPNCQGPDAKFQARVKIGDSDDLFVAYADNLRRMIHTAADNQQKLLEVINQIFTYTIDTKTGKRVIRVNPALTEKSLQEAVEKTRRYIMDLYIKCEDDYTQGVKLYSAIVESKNAEIVPRQIESLTAESDKLVGSVEIPVGALEEEEVIELGKEAVTQEPIDKEAITQEPIDKEKAIDTSLDTIGQPQDKSTAFGQIPIADENPSNQPVTSDKVNDQAFGPAFDKAPASAFDKAPASAFDQPPAPAFDEAPASAFTPAFSQPPASAFSQPPAPAFTPAFDQAPAPAFTPAPATAFDQAPAFDNSKVGQPTGFDETRLKQLPQGPLPQGPLPQGGKLSKKNKRVKKHSTKRNKH
jgi:hypothetical protein